MKLNLIALLLLTTVISGWGVDIPQGAVIYFAQKYGHKHPDAVQIVQVNFNEDSSREYLMTFAKGDWEGPEGGWTVVELKNGSWVEPKTLDTDGQIKDFGAVDFDPELACFAYLPSYKHNGILAHSRKSKTWWFTYLAGDVLNTVYFWTPSQVGLTDESLQKLMESKKMTVVQQQVQ